MPHLKKLGVWKSLLLKICFLAGTASFRKSIFRHYWILSRIKNELFPTWENIYYIQCTERKKPKVSVQHHLVSRKKDSERIIFTEGFQFKSSTHRFLFTLKKFSEWVLHKLACKVIVNLPHQNRIVPDLHLFRCVNFHFFNLGRSNLNLESLQSEHVEKSKRLNLFILNISIAQNYSLNNLSQFDSKDCGGDRESIHFFDVFIFQSSPKSQLAQKAGDDTDILSIEILLFRGSFGTTLNHQLVIDNRKI